MHALHGAPGDLSVCRAFALAAAVKALRDGVGRLAPAVGFLSGEDRGRDRDARQPWRRWYRLARWRKLALGVLQRDGFRCRMCGRVEVRARLECDHVEPHRGDWDKFWAGPFQTLCKPCHGSAKQRAERGGGVG